MHPIGKCDKECLIIEDLETSPAYEISLGGGDVSPALGLDSCDHTNRFVLWFPPLCIK